MLLSIIIPTYNRAQQVKLAISSVLKTQIEDFELIVVDDCSSDGTIDALRLLRDSRLKVIQSPLRKNGNVARNAGLNIARGEFVSFLDSDDYFLDCRIPDLMSCLSTADFDLLLDSFLVKKKSNISPITYPNKYLDQENLASILAAHAIPITCSTITCKKSIALRSNGFDEDFARQQDRDFLLTICENRVRIMLRNSQDVVKVQNETSISRSSSNYMKSLNDLMEKHQKIFDKQPRYIIDYLFFRGVLQSIKDHGILNWSHHGLDHSLEFWKVIRMMFNYPIGKWIRRCKAREINA